VNYENLGREKSQRNKHAKHSDFSCGFAKPEVRHGVFL
jgi:hypothetical protein